MVKNCVRNRSRPDEIDTETEICTSQKSEFYFRFLANVLRYVRYMQPSVCCLLSVCLSVCCLSVTLVHPTQAVELFRYFFYHTIAQGLYFSGAKNRWWGTPLAP